MTTGARRASRLLPFGLALLTAASVLATTSPDSLASQPVSVRRGLDYLHAVQGSSGQFQDAGYTPWAIIAIAASGENPDGAAWRRNGKTPMDYLQSLDLASYATQSLTGNAAAFYAKTILAYVAAGHRGKITAAGAGKVNLVDKLLGFQRSDGRFCPAPSAPSIAAVNTTTWAIIALTAAQTGQSSVSSAVAWLRAQQLSDGGFSSNAKDAAAGLPSDVDDTSAAVEALVAGGVGAGTDVLKNARAYLRGSERSDGGFSSDDNGSYTYSESTAWAIQAILALGESPASSAWTQNGRTPQSTLAALQAANGAFQHKKGTLALPILSTTQALCALSGESFASFPRGRTNWVTPFAAAPRITGFSPSAGATVHSSSVTVRASYRDPAGGTGIAISSIRIVVDGRDKTGEAKVGASSLSVPLSHPTIGRHTVRLTVRDRAGNARTATHNFTVVGASTFRSAETGTSAGGGVGASGGQSSGSATSGASSGGQTTAGAQGEAAAGAAAGALAGTGVTPGVMDTTGTSGAAAASTPSAAASPQPGMQSASSPVRSPGSTSAPPDRTPLIFASAALIPLAIGFAVASQSHRRARNASQDLRLAAPPDRRPA